MRHRAGFTLIEILVVVAIVAGLAALAIPNQLRARMVANASSASGNLGALMGGAGHAPKRPAGLSRGGGYGVR